MSFCPVLFIRFANQFAGVIDFEILHYADSPRSLDVLLIFAHDDLRFLKLKKHLACVTGKMLTRADILFFSWLLLQPAGEGVWGRGTRRAHSYKSV